MPDDWEAGVAAAVQAADREAVFAVEIEIEMVAELERAEEGLALKAGVHNLSVAVVAQHLAGTAIVHLGLAWFQESSAHLF